MTALPWIFRLPWWVYFIVLPIIAMAVAFTLFQVVIPLVRWRVEKGSDRRGMRRCACGYILDGLQVPRCPECGRAIGFDKTFEQLGIDEGEVRAYAEAKP